MGDAPMDSSGQHSATIVLDSEDQDGVGMAIPQTPSSVPLQAPEIQPTGRSMSPPASSLPSQKRMWSPLVSPQPSQSLRRTDFFFLRPWEIGYVFLCSPVASLVFPLTLFFFLKFFGLQGVVLQSYKGFLSSYEEASASSSRAGHPEGELKALTKEKVREEGILQRRLKNLAGEHTIVHKKHATSTRRMEAVRAKLEGM
ncbi:hypothetical protein LIER_12859 [Lithospermum erythrorhizon]|uniref:Uncharacterized protein n=1 Tax=Lithospermum erythrorhizon TaxID=34254 RepID=A0AAV3PV67_LITER